MMLGLLPQNPDVKTKTKNKTKTLDVANNLQWSEYVF